MLHHPCILGGPETREVKIRTGSLTPAFSGIPKQREIKSEWHVSRLPQGPKRAPKCYGILAFSGVPKQPGTTSEVDASPVHSRRPKKGRKCYVTPTFSGLKGDKIRSICLTFAFSRARKRAKMLCHPCILRDPQTKGDKIRGGYLTPAFSRARKRAEMLF